MRIFTFMKKPILNYFTRLVSFLLFFVSVSAVAQQHTIGSFAPTNAGAGETVTITGTNFSSITGVTFGGIAAASFTVVSATKITAVTGSGSSGSVAVAKTGFTTATKTGFTFSAIPTITGISTDFGGFWNSNTTVNNGTYPNDAHHLLSFTYDGITYSTGVNDAALSTNGVSYTSGNYKGLPVIMQGNTSGASLFIVAASNIDGNTAAGIYTHPKIKDLTIQSVLSDGINGLDLGTGYTNLPVGAISNFSINSIMPTKIADTDPAFIITQIADPSTSAFDTYKFVDAGGATVGNQVQIDLSKISPLGTYYLDLFTVPLGSTYLLAKPNGISAANTTRQLRFMALRLSDFGITTGNFSQVKFLQILPSGVTDMAFVAYNAAAINVPPSIEQDLTASNTKICSPGGGSAFLKVGVTAASGGTLSYVWEVSTDGGTSWLPVSDGGIYSGAANNALIISSASAGDQYRATVTESGSGYSATSAAFIISSIANVALAGTLNPVGFTNCLNSGSGTTFLTVNPTGGTGSYNYQWSSSTTSGGTYTDIAGANYKNFSPPLSSNGTLYYKVLITSGCLSNLSAAAAVTINGEVINTVTNGSVCNTGIVPLSATATGGTINWYAASTGGASLGTGNNFNTPSINATTTYYVGTTSGTCLSSRIPVVATVVSTIALSSANFNITNATDVCAGAGPDITVNSSNLIDASYTINYSITGSNTVGSATATMTVTGGNGTFTTAPLSNAGANTITITGVVIGGCTITPSSGNTRSFNVNSGSPLAGSFSLAVSAGCTNAGSTVTVSSNTLASGTYLLTYNISGTNTIASTTAQIIFTAGTPGTGTFNLPALSNSGGGNTLNATAIALLSSPDCSSILNSSSGAFITNMPPVADAGLPQLICATDAAKNITASASAANYSALAWSSSNGTGTFTNNTTAQALSATGYQPDAADVTRGFVYLTLTATANTGCADITKTVTLSISPVSSGGKVTADQTIVSGTQPVDLVLTGYTGTVTKWQKSADAAFSNPIDIASTATTLTGAVIGNLITTTYFRAVVKSGACGEASSGYAIISISTLPINLLYFTGQCVNNATSLEWATASEINNKYFTVERSADGNNWRIIKTIAGAANSSQLNTYSYKDSGTSSTNNFYRLKQTDFDGRNTYSKVLNLTCNALRKNEMIIAPNPGKDIFVISNLPVNGLLRIYNAQGTQVITPMLIRNARTSVDFKNLPAGVYYVLTGTGDETVSGTLIKK